VIRSSADSTSLAPCPSIQTLVNEVLQQRDEQHASAVDELKGSHASAVAEAVDAAKSEASKHHEEEYTTKEAELKAEHDAHVAKLVSEKGEVEEAHGETKAQLDVSLFPFLPSNSLHLRRTDANPESCRLSLRSTRRNSLD